MRAWAVVRNEEPLQCIEVIDPEPDGTQVVLDVTHCGVCHSDLHFWKGTYNMGGGRVMKLTDRGVTLPRAIGHEVVGRVVKIGPDAKGIAIGDRRIVYPWIGCGTCERCQAGEDNLCDKPNSIGVMQHGGFATRVMVPHPRYLVDPGTVDPALAATFACSSLTVFSAIKKVMPLAPHEPVVLIGAGGLGLAAISTLKALGHENIVTVEINEAKRAAALAAGASDAVDGSGSDLSERIVKSAGRQVKAVIDFVGATDTAQAGFDTLAKGGKLVLVGVAGGEIPLSLAGMIFKPRAILGSATGTIQDLRDVVALAQSGKLKPVPIVRFSRDSVNEALHKLHEGQITGRIVLS